MQLERPYFSQDSVGIFAIVVGNLGDDTMSGGPGADVFIFGGNSGNDVIVGFSFVEGDQIWTSAGSVSWTTDNNGGTLMTFDNGGTVDIVGVAPFDASAIHFF